MAGAWVVTTCAGAAPDLAGSQKMIQVGVCMNQGLNLQTQTVNDLHDEFGVAAGVKNVGVAGGGVSQNGAVALQGPDGEAFVHYAHAAESYRFSASGNGCRYNRRSGRNDKAE